MQVLASSGKDDEILAAADEAALTVVDAALSTTVTRYSSIQMHFKGFCNDCIIGGCQFGSVAWS
jgi:hypothetical protein